MSFKRYDKPLISHEIESGSAKSQFEKLIKKGSEVGRRWE